MKMMTKPLVLFVLTAALCDVAIAQPSLPPAPDNGAPIEPEPPPPPPPPPPPARVETPTPRVTDSVTSERPSELSFGIGFGYSLPAAIDMPNVTSVRIRLGSGLTFEPRLTLGSTSSGMDGGTTTTVTDTVTQLGLAALIRKPLISRGRADFELLGAVGLDSLKTDPDGDNNNTTVTTLSASWGIAVCYWLSPHWQLSFSAGNPILAATSTKKELPTMVESKTTQTTFGLIFDPRIAIMIHLYN